MIFLLVSIAVVFLSTGFCALVEAALYAVQPPYIRQLADSGHRSGRLLMKFKERMDYPISAILIFDTLLGVGGAAVAGSYAHALFGPEYVIWFSLGLSACLLIVSQIIPKILGVVYNKAVARSTAIPISVAIAILYPVVWIIEIFTRNLQPDEPPQRASEDEVMQMARISAEEGSILDIESDLIQNSLMLNDVQASQIMTPREKVVVLPADMTLQEAFSTFQDRSFSRIPIHRPGEPGHWIGVVMSRDILTEMARGNQEWSLNQIAKRLTVVPGNTSGHLLLNAFLKRRSHLFAVSGEQGTMTGVVSLEDVIEELLGKEIVDEREADK